MKNPAAVLLGMMKSEKKAAAARVNGSKGGYWQQKRNRSKLPQGLNRLYERRIDIDSLINK
jgi:hypothetical protein